LIFIVIAALKNRMILTCRCGCNWNCRRSHRSWTY